MKKLKIGSPSFKERVTIVTHDGKFHADEVVAVALLKIFVSMENGLGVIRTRDRKAFEEANFVLDVSGRFDGVKYFDHHQFTKLDENYGFSSAGLIMAFIDIEEGVYPALDYLLDEVDENDIGEVRHAGNHFCGIINSYNHEEIYSKYQNSQFQKAVIFAEEYILNLIRGDILKSEQKKLAEIVKPIAINGVDIILMEKDDVFVPAGHFMGRADIVIQHDDYKNVWTTQTVNISKSEFGSKYKILPNETPEEEFCHKAGFISSNRAKNGQISLKLSSGRSTTQIWVDVEKKEEVL